MPKKQYNGYLIINDKELASDLKNELHQKEHSSLVKGKKKSKQKSNLSLLEELTTDTLNDLNRTIKAINASLERLNANNSTKEIEKQFNEHREISDLADRVTRLESYIIKKIKRSYLELI